MWKVHTFSVEQNSDNSRKAILIIHKIKTNCLTQQLIHNSNLDPWSVEGWLFLYHQLQQGRKFLHWFLFFLYFVFSYNWTAFSQLAGDPCLRYSWTSCNQRNQSIWPWALKGFHWCTFFGIRYLLFFHRDWAFVSTSQP